MGIRSPIEGIKNAAYKSCGLLAYVDAADNERFSYGNLLLLSFASLILSCLKFTFFYNGKSV